MCFFCSFCAVAEMFFSGGKRYFDTGSRENYENSFWTQIDSKKFGLVQESALGDLRKMSREKTSKRNVRGKLTESKNFLDSKIRFFCKKLLTNRKSESSMRSIFDALCRLIRGD